MRWAGLHKPEWVGQVLGWVGVWLVALAEMGSGGQAGVSYQSHKDDPGRGNSKSKMGREVVLLCCKKTEEASEVGAKGGRRSQVTWVHEFGELRPTSELSVIIKA